MVSPLLLLFLASPSFVESSVLDQAVFTTGSHNHANNVTLPVPDPTRSFWTDAARNPLATEGSTGPLTSDADICIIGSGMTGVGAAHAISRLGLNSSHTNHLNVVILEARDFCSGATGRNGGHLSPDPLSSFSSLSREYGPREALKSLMLENYTANVLLPYAVDTDLVKGRRVKLMLDKHEEERARKDWRESRAYGWEPQGLEWMSAREMLEAYGTPHPALIYPGNTLWPLKLVANLYNHAAASTSLNLTLHTRTPVTSITPLPRGSFRRQTLHTPRGNITCTSVLHASNGYAAYLLPHTRIVPVRGQILALRASHWAWNAGPRWGWGWVTNGGNEYWLTRGENEGRLVLIGGGREVSQSDPPFETYITDDGKKNELVGRFLREYLDRIFPVSSARVNSSDSEVAWEWTGIKGYTSTDDPLVGPVLAPSPSSTSGKQARASLHEGEFISAGYSGHGMPRAYGCAEVVAWMMVDEFMDRKERLHKRSDSTREREWWKREKMEKNVPEWFPRRYLTWNRMGHD